MRESVTIWYRGASYQLGKGQLGTGQPCYGIWPVQNPRPQPLEQWPETPEGWSAAWSRFTAVEAPGTIAHVSQRLAPAGTAVTAVILLAVGVACGFAGLFPSYLLGSSLAQQASQWLPHAIYLAVWAASALLVLAGGTRRRVGALLALGMSIVTFGFFFADLGMVIAGGAHLLGLGLVLGLAGWLACAAGSVLAFRLPSADAPRKLQGHATGSVVTLAAAAIAALGTAIAFAPSWDRYTLRTPAGLVQSLTAGNSFANPAPVIAGDVAVMVTLVVVVVAAALWRPIRLGAVLLAGAAIPMAAQAISALAQISEPLSPAQFGITPAQASQVGLTISTGLTTAFWIYCVFVVALAVTCAWMLILPRLDRPAGVTAAPGNMPSPVPAATAGAEDSRGLVPGTAGRQDG